MNSAIAARRPEPHYRPAFMVQKLEGTFKKKLVSRDKKQGFVYKEVDRDRGWLVSFPAKHASAKGHSIHIESYEELERLGFADTEVPLVDEDGEKVGAVPNNAVKGEK